MRQQESSCDCPVPEGSAVIEEKDIETAIKTIKVVSRKKFYHLRKTKLTNAEVGEKIVSKLMKNYKFAFILNNSFDNDREHLISEIKLAPGRVGGKMPDGTKEALPKKIHELFQQSLLHKLQETPSEGLVDEAAPRKGLPPMLKTGPDKTPPPSVAG
jgi:hypothetical protein